MNILKISFLFFFSVSLSACFHSAFKRNTKSKYTFEVVENMNPIIDVIDSQIYDLLDSVISNSFILKDTIEKINNFKLPVIGSLNFYFDDIDKCNYLKIKLNNDHDLLSYFSLNYPCTSVLYYKGIPFYNFGCKNNDFWRTSIKDTSTQVIIVKRKGNFLIYDLFELSHYYKFDSVSREMKLKKVLFSDIYN